jgi:glycosyltransferase involved in cell wall biosynthesis
VNVLQIHSTDAGLGGGPIAMLRLHDGLRKAGVGSRILCARATRPDSVSIPRSRGEGRLRAVAVRLGLNELHSIGSLSIPTLAAYRESDVLHLHCVHDGFFHYLALPRATRTKPGVYTLHDMWPFTGHCCHSFTCDRWTQGCGRCPDLQTPNAVRRDATAWEWRLKDWAYRRSNLTIVAPSRWMYERATRSMLQRFPIHHIPHGVDTDLYQPLDRELSRAALGLPRGKHVLLYLARRMNPSHAGARIKGPDLLARAVREMPPALKKDTVLVLIGEGSDALIGELDIATIPLGFVSSDRLKALAYSAADLLVFPSRAENAPLVLIEAMACGTPAVAFSIGGVPDMVRPGQTGVLAEPEDPKSLAAGIVRVLENPDLLRDLRGHCRRTAVDEYSLDQHIERHIALYRQALRSAAA